MMRAMVDGITRLAAAALAVVALCGAAPKRDYAEGQVWEYTTRPGDEGSLLKIQKIENNSDFGDKGPIYHISVIGFKFANPQMRPVLPHSPVTRAVLDQSVTRLSSSTAEFPSAEEGIAEWRRGKGGVFTISVAQIVDIVDQQTRSVGQ